MIMRNLSSYNPQEYISNSIVRILVHMLIVLVILPDILLCIVNSSISDNI